MTKITPDNINQAIQKYWGMRAEGFSLSNNDEFADPDNPYRQLLQRKLGLNHSGQKALDVGCGPGFLAIELAKLDTRAARCGGIFLSVGREVQFRIVGL